MPNFEEILDKPVGEIEKPKPRPAGTYLAVVQGLPVRNKIGTEEHDTVDFKLKLISAGTDVDQDALSEVPPINEWAPVTDRHWVNTEQAIYYFQEFLKNVLDFSGIPIKQAIAESPGRQYYVKMKQRPYVNREGQPDIQFEVESRAHV